MATSAERRLRPKEVRRFGSLRAPHSIPDLTEIQTRSYEAFLQYDVPPQKRIDQGIEGGGHGSSQRARGRCTAARAWREWSSPIESTTAGARRNLLFRHCAKRMWN